ncbi:MAG: phosphotransferase [Prevotella sp.]|nr:phosphotransferase [Prevotella sp.]
MQQLSELYKRWAGEKAQSVEKLAGAGSNRRYYRITNAKGETVIGVEGTSVEENNAFVYLSKHFKNCNLPVPEVYGVSDDKMCYIQQDLGGLSLFDAIKQGREAGGVYNEYEESLLVDAIRLLPEVQFEGARDLDWSVCYPQQEFNTDNVMFDLNYFKYCFLKTSGVDFHEMRLEEEFRSFAKDLVTDKNNTFLYRDFQARNIMLVPVGCVSAIANPKQESGCCSSKKPAPDNKDAYLPYLIDFQGGRRGPFYYDLASFIWQASAHYSPELRDKLTKEYYNSLQQYTDVPSWEHFSERLSLFVLFRIMQVLGAYGFRGYFEKKKHFIDSIPPALENLSNILAKGNFPYPYLTDVLKRLACECGNSETKASSGLLPQDGMAPVMSNKSDAADKADEGRKSSLVVRIFSFSYKKGIPEDESGNGGGYVFDCRSTHNPGRYEPYKQITGLDEKVIRFLEDDGEITTFLDSVYKLADAHVQRYIERGFTSLMFSFGCTGGQHRSVYSAQHLAEHLHEKFGIEVRLVHREQNITQIFKPGK